MVPDNQQSFLKFLWWNNGNLLEEPQDFVMCVHVFGLVGHHLQVVQTMLLEELL